MSDLFVSLPPFSEGGHVLFGKNAHREPNEGLSTVRMPATEAEDKQVDCTYVSVPRPPGVLPELLLCKPFHTWGAEMGVNSHGLAIGYTEVFTRVKLGRKNNGLTGPDLVRLGLERAQTPEQALEAITGLLEAYGQDACNGYQDKNYFHSNSFLIAGPKEAILLETAGQEWVAKKLNGFFALSNALTINAEFAHASKGVIDTAKRNGWLKKGKDFSFKEAYTDKGPAKRSKAATRQATATALAGEAGAFNVRKAVDLLRAHQKPPAVFNPSVSGRADLSQFANRCNPFQTTGAMVAVLRSAQPHTCWLTGSSAPCISAFKPFFVPGLNVFDGIVREPAQLANDSFWWKAELFHRDVALNYKKAVAYFGDELAAFQQSLFEEEAALMAGSTGTEDLNVFSNKALNTHAKKIMTWHFHLKKNHLAGKQFSPLYNSFVKKLTKQVQAAVS